MPLTQTSRGILLMLTAILLFTAMDALAKHLLQSYHTVQVVWAMYSSNRPVSPSVFRATLTSNSRRSRTSVTPTVSSARVSGGVSVRTIRAVGGLGIGWGPAG